jgi:outer membrane protein assembly factor BamB
MPRLLCLLITISCLLCSCGGGSAPVDKPDPGPDPVPGEPQLADPSEVQQPQAILPPVAIIWPGQGGDPGNSARTGLQLPVGTPQIASVSSISSLSSSSAKIAPDGSVLVGSGALLQCFSPAGALKWQRSLLRQLNGTPLTDSQGQILISSGSPAWVDGAGRSNWIEALGPDGSSRWRFDTGDYPALVYGLAADDSVLVRSDFGRLSLLSPGGMELWNHDLEALAIYNAVFDEAGNIYVGTDRQTIVSLDAAGNERWSYNPADATAGSLTTNRRLLHPQGGMLLLTGVEGDARSFRVSRLSAQGKLMGSFPCDEQFSFTWVDDIGDIWLHDRASRISVYNLDGQLQRTIESAYGFPFGINATAAARYYSVLASPDNFSEFLLTGTDSLGQEQWRLSSQWSFRYPVLAEGGLLYSGDEQSFFALDTQGRRHWQQIHGARLQGLSVSSADRIYSCGGRNLYAFSKSGEQLWQISAEGQITAAPAILPSGQLAFGDSLGFFYIYENNGTRYSKFILEGAISSTPCIGSDGTMFIGTQNGEVYSFAPDNSPLRKFTADAGVASGIAMDADGTAYIATLDGHVHALYTDGVEAWERNLGEPLAGQLVVGDDFRIYGATAAGRVFALHRFDGTLLWDYFIGASVADGLALSGGGQLIVTTDEAGGQREEPQLTENGSGRGVYLFTLDGNIAWSRNGPYSFSGQPLVDGNGRICVEAGGWLLSFDDSGNEVWRIQLGFEDDISAAAPLSDGRFAVCSGTQLLILD